MLNISSLFVNVHLFAQFLHEDAFDAFDRFCCGAQGNALNPEIECGDILFINDGLAINLVDNFAEVPIFLLENCYFLTKLY